MRFKTTIFSQLLKEIPRYEFERIVKKHSGDKRVRKLRCWDQLTGLLYHQLTKRSSLRDLVSSYNSNYKQFYHLGSNQLKRSTLSDANNNRSYKIFEEVFNRLLERSCIKQTKEIKEVVKLIDATIIVLNKTKYDWATGHKDKSGIKIHTVYDLSEELPVHYEITNDRVNDIESATKLEIEKNITYVFDKGYYKFEWWKKIDNNNSFFVTRLKKNSPTKTIRERKIKSPAIKIDQEVFLNKRIARSRKNPYDKPIRKVTVKLEGKEPLVLVTNDMKRSAEEIAELYKKRWQIELFFKWIKQNLKIKTFLGTSENAVKIQVITALIAFLLLRITQKSLPFKKSLQSIVRIVQTNLMRKVELWELFMAPPDKSAKPINLQFEFNYF